CASRARCRNGAKSGLASGTRIVSMICAPPLTAASLNVVSDSTPGAQSLTMVTIFLAPFLTAQSAMIADDCPSVKLVRTMNGERSVVTDAPDTMTTIGILASVASGATVSADGVIPAPRIAILSLTI